MNNFKVLLLAIFLVFPAVSSAMTPVVDTTISLSKTGSEPFDSSTWTGDGPGGAVMGGVNAGLDGDEDNNVVRLQDSITYKVEVSVNDSDVEDLVTTVSLVNNQKWITIPTGCKIDPADVGAQPVSSISADGVTLFCNMGPAIEGTTRVIFPAARAVGVDPITGGATRNDDIVQAQVSSQAFSADNGASLAATDGPTEVIVTGFFRVDLQKQLKSTATDPDTGAFLYQAPTKTGETGRAGSIIEYTLLAKYVKGSLLADGDGDTTLPGDPPGVASYRIVDVLTDDNINNDTATLSTGALLYDWDATTPACELLGDHGASATVSCTQLVSAIDDVGPGATGPDGLNDLAIQIDLANIDVTDPDNDANLFEIRLNIWFDRINDIDSHQICTTGGQPECINTTTNRLGFWDGTSTVLNSFDEMFDDAPNANPGIVSTEDASGMRVDNYNAGFEPFPNEVSYPLTTSSPGSYAAHKAFTSLFRYADTKFPDQTMAAGETRPFLMNIYDYRKIDQAESQMCDKIDTQVFEYAGVAPPNQIGSPALYSWNQNRPWNPVMSTFGGPNGTTLGDGSALVEFFFTNRFYDAAPMGGGTPPADQAAYINEMRTATCEDDLNADGFVVFKNLAGDLVDASGDPAVVSDGGAGTMPATDADIDWWMDATMVPPVGGGAGDVVNVTRVRQDSIYDAALANAQDPTHERFAIAVNHLITAKLITASPYGGDNRLPNFASYNRQEATGLYTGWLHVGPATENPDADAVFSIQSGTVDRMTLVPSSHSIAKRTEPSGIKVVRGGDTVEFIVEPKVFGLWEDGASNTATIGDNLPTGTDYIANSEMFSSDGGTTWYSRADWDIRFASNLEKVSITSAPHVSGADPMSWAFGSLESSSVVAANGVSDQLPLIKYQVLVDPSRVSGTFVNIATIDSGDIGETVKQARYQLTILPEFGLDVLKTVDEPVHGVNESFDFDLIYKNLGGEAYNSGEFIDILPYVGDTAPTTGGVNSSRDPGTAYSGTYELARIISSNGETFYATNAASASIEEDPCDVSNRPAGYTPPVPPAAPDVCTLTYVQNGNMLPDGAGLGAMGSGATSWTQCTALNPLTCGALTREEITGVRFEAPTLPAAEGGQTVTFRFQPLGNLGGEPNLVDGKVTAAATGDIYTNTFGGRVGEISLDVISNDVSVTFVSGSIGDTVWYDLDGDGNGPIGAGDETDITEPPIVGAQVALLDAAGNPVFIDPDTGAVVPSDYTGGMNPPIPYVSMTDANGMYVFENLPVDTYSVQVTPPAGAVPSSDADGIATPNISTYDLQPETDEAGQLIGVEDNVDQDFGYTPPLQIGSTVWLDVDNDGMQGPLAMEPGIEGVIVQLFRVGDDPTTATPVDMAITDIDGNYLLGTSVPGDYFVYIPEPPAVATLSSTPPNTNANANDDGDGDDNGIQAAPGDPVQSGPITLAAGLEPTGAAESAIGTGGAQDDGVLDGNGNMTVDFGFYPTGSIGDQIFVDYDGDGIVDTGAGEAGIGGVTVTLTYTDLDGTAITLTTTTELDGTYLFDDLPLGINYTVTVDTSTLPGVLGDSLEESYDPDGGAANTSMLTLTTMMPDRLDQDFGYRPIGSLGDTVWYDANNDGVQDAGEMGIEDVTLALQDQMGNPIYVNAMGMIVPMGTAGAVPYTTTTDANGNYLFDQLPVGDYRVVVTDDNNVLTDYDQTYDADDGATNSPGTPAQSDVSLALDPMDPLTVLGNLNQDFGFVEPVSIGGFIWSDLDADGIQDANEPPIHGSTVTLLNADGTPATDFNGDPVDPIVVGANGQYIFDNLLEGDYKIQVTKPSGFAPSPIQNSADDDDASDDSNIANEVATDVYESGVFTLTGGDEPSGSGEDLVGDDQDDAAIARDESGNMTVDFAFVEVASIGDTVWLDLDNDGVQDANEDGIAGVTVNLYEDTDGDGVISGAEATTPVATVLTGPDGEYLFPDLTPGVVYQTGVDVSTVPDGLLQTYDEGDGFGATDSLSDPITLDPGEFHDTADFAYGPPGGAIGDTIWVDSNDDGVQDPGELGIGGVVVTLTYFDAGGDEVVLTTMTAPDGTYLFTDLPLDTTFVVEVDTDTLPAGYVSGPSNLGDPDVRDGNSTVADNTTYITLTPDAPVNLEADFGYLPPPGQDNSVGDTIYLDTDGSGVQATDGTEPGIAGVTVALIDVDRNVLAVTTTDANGNYLFTGVPDGVYDVVVTDATGELSDYTQTGDPDAALDNTSTVSLDPTSVDDMPVVDLLQDFGYQPPAPLNNGVIGDTIFLDADNSGTPDDGEGIGGVVVELYDENGNLLASTVTDSDGNYLFTGLETSPGGVSYEVRVDTSTLPAGLTNSVDPDALTGIDGDSISTGVVLTDAAPEDLDQDFGYTSSDNNTISGTIWPDTDGNGLQDETGSFGGVTVELRDENGNVIQTTTTDSNGDYAFTNLPDGIYTVVVTDEDMVLSSASHTDTPNGAGDTSDATSKNDQGYVVDLDSAGANPNPVTDDTGDFGYEPVITNPITLGSFTAVTVTGGVQINWSTQTEVSNLGFNIYAQFDGAWTALNDSLIVGQGDSVSIQSYSMIVAQSAEVFALGDVDVNGLETMHGPFMLDQAYGEIGERQTIDWQGEKAEREAKEAERELQRQQQQRDRNEQLRQLLQGQSTSQLDRSESNEGYEMDSNQNSSWIQRTVAMVLAAVIPSAHAQGSLEMDLINLETIEAGIHQVTHADLINQAAPLDLSGVPVAQIALLNQGQPAKIQVIGSSADDNVFGVGASIRFIAEQQDTLYSDTNVYTLRLVDVGNPTAQRIIVDGAPVPNGAPANAYLAKARFAPQAKYSFASPDTEDPWYAMRILASGQEASDSVQLKLDNVALGGNSGSTKAKLKVNLWGASALNGTADDHSVKVNFNNQEVVSDSFDGLVKQEMSATLDQVNAGNNTVEVVLPMDTGYAYDAVNVDEIEVSYPRQFVAIDDQLNFTSTFSKFQLAGLSNSNVVVMREDANGVWMQSSVNGSCRGECQVQFGGTGQLADYFVSTVDALHEPALAALPLEQDITSQNATYLIISHPDFVNAASLQSLKIDLTSEFGSAQIVDVNAIYAQFGHHLFGPNSIQAYIQDSVANRGTQYVLLVGGDVYDYRQFENEDATSFIPSIYKSTGNSINFSPVDAKYVDLDNDNVPDLPIGRLPVRTVAQLDSLLSKRTDYIARTYNGKVLLVADEYDVAQQYDFADDADEVEADFLSSFSTTKAYVDDLGVAQARQAAVNGINSGQSLTAFFGHSSTNQWAFSGLFTGNDAAGLSNFGKPTVVTQWGCWNAYYVSPNEDSMGHRFMMEGDRGAVAVMGASTLTNANSERKLARLVFQRLANGERLGDAITSAKQDYAIENPEDLDVLLGWTLLGLPELIIN